MVVFAARPSLNYHEPITASSFVFGTKHELIFAFYKDLPPQKKSGRRLIKLKFKSVFGLQIISVTKVEVMHCNKHTR